jgi:hypothetical protein
MEAAALVELDRTRQLVAYVCCGAGKSAAMTFVLTLWNHRLTDICVAADGIPEALRTRLGTTDRHVITAPGVHELVEAAKEGLDQDFCDLKNDEEFTPAKLCAVLGLTPAHVREVAGWSLHVDERYPVKEMPIINPTEREGCTAKAQKAWLAQKQEARAARDAFRSAIQTKRYLFVTEQKLTRLVKEKWLMPEDVATCWIDEGDLGQDTRKDFLKDDGCYNLALSNVRALRKAASVAAEVAAAASDAGSTAASPAGDDADDDTDADADADAEGGRGGRGRRRHRRV